MSLYKFTVKAQNVNKKLLLMSNVQAGIQFRKLVTSCILIQRGVT